MRRPAPKRSVLQRGIRGSPEATLFERLAMALGCGAAGFLLGLSAWMSCREYTANSGLIPFHWVYWFAGLMAILGFLLLDGVIAWIVNALGRIGDFLFFWRGW